MGLARYSTYWGKVRAEEKALIFRDEHLSWAELDSRANALAGCFQAWGVAKGDRIGCLLPNCIDWVLCYVATLKVGAIVVPLNPRFGDHELREIEAQVQCAVVVSEPGLISKLIDNVPATGVAGQTTLYRRAGGDVLCRSLQEALSDAREPEPLWNEPRDVAVISFTSGSTGLPKGVTLTHAAIEAVAHSQIVSFGWTSQEQVLLLAPFSFTGGVITVLAPSYVVGACLHIEEGPEPERVLDLILQRGITALTAVPIFFERIAACSGFEQADLSRLRSAVTGGAPVPEALLRRYLKKGVSIRHTYGCTEGAGMLAMPTERDAIERPTSCGWPLPTVDICLLNDANQFCASGEPGEILIRGTQVTQAYWRNPEADQGARTQGWFRTGDIGCFDEQGRLQIVDRKKSMIITGGVNVYPAEVERAISSLPDIKEVLVFGRPDSTWGERVVAVVFGPVHDAGGQLMETCRKLLGAYKAPKELLISDRPLPRTSSGKLSRLDIERFCSNLTASAERNS